MEIDENQSIGLIGESGSGKTTLAKLLIGIEEPNEGKIEYFGKELNKLTMSELVDYRRNCQMVFQDPSSQFNPRMNIYEILEEPLRINGIKDQKEDKIRKTLELVSLSQDILSRYIHQVSGGQRQRISIARALILNPSFIICDEPVSALDISVQSQILNLLYDLKTNLGVNYLLISHDLSVVKFLCDYIYILYSGRIVERGKTDEIFNTPVHPYTKELINATNLSLENLITFPSQDDTPNDNIDQDRCVFTRCPRYKECIGNNIKEFKITETHSVYCNL